MTKHGQYCMIKNEAQTKDAYFVLHVGEKTTDCTIPPASALRSSFRLIMGERTERSQMDNMRWLVLLEQLLRLLRISSPASTRPPSASTRHINRGSEHAHLKSASLDDAKIQVSPGFLPNLEPSGSVSMTYWMALPTRPEPPVTRIVDISATQKTMREDVVGERGMRSAAESRPMCAEGDLVGDLDAR